MSSIFTSTTTANRTFGMPVCGRAFGMSGSSHLGLFQDIFGTDAKDRGTHVATALVDAYPGTLVWRPPRC